jgi:signal transduction histidine kinase
VPASPDALIWGVVRSADDSRARPAYRSGMSRSTTPLALLRAMPRMQRVDAVLALALTGLLVLQLVLIPDVEHPWWVAAVYAPICLALAFRRAHPVVVGFGTQALLSLTYPTVHGPAGPVTVAWFCALYALAVWTRTWVFVAALFFVVLANGGPDLFVNPQGAGPQFGLAAAGVMALVRVVVGGRDRQLRVAKREQQVAAREAVVEERERIARELHDVIAHHVSTMVMQAGAERRTLGQEQAETREVLGTIERVGRGALTEMRRMVAMLRQDPAQELMPQPTLADVPELVTQMRAAGLPIAVQVTGERRELAQGIELSAYRIVQEALTNALKHASGAHATVEIRYGPDELELVVRDDGRASTAPVDSGGHGLVGMRERVAMYGGSIEAGPDLDAGFAVRVRLPVR